MTSLQKRDAPVSPANSGEPPVLQVANLVKHFPIKAGLLRRTVGAVQAVSGVSFDLYPRETLGIVGESGCGKSTTGRAVLNLQPATSGSVKFKGQELVGLDAKTMRPLRRDLQFVFQDPYASLNPRLTVNSIVGEALIIHNLVGNKKEQLERVRDLLATVGLNPEHGNRFPHEFSGGQRQRVGIARALAVEPQVIILDEPVSALDVSIQAGVVNLLEDLQAKMGIAYVFIAHDLSVVRHIADRVAVMYLGRIVEIADTDDLFDRPTHPYTQALISAIPVPDPRKERARQRITITGDVPSPVKPPSGCHFRTRCQVFRDLLDDGQRQKCMEEYPDLADRGSGHPTACHYAEVRTLL